LALGLSEGLPELSFNLGPSSKYSVGHQSKPFRILAKVYFLINCMSISISLDLVECQIILSLLSKAREEVEKSLWLMGKWGDVPCPSVTSISSYTFGPRWLKLDRINPQISGSKSV